MIKIVLVDNREPKNIINKGFEVMPDLTIARLDVGDVVNGDIVIERKTANDLISSLNSKRLSNQIANMKDNYKIPILIITGSYKDVAKNNHQDVSAKRYRSAIDEIKLLDRIPVFEIPKSKDEEKFWKKCEWIFRKAKTGSPSTIRVVKRKTSDARVAALCGVPNLGEKRANAIIKQFPRIKDVCNASVEDLMTVRGIGKQKANSIKKIF